MSPLPSVSMPSLRNISSTPIKKKTYLQALFSTYTRFRDATHATLGRSMEKHIVGPMPVQEFLSTFFPESHASRDRMNVQKVKLDRFKEVTARRNEVDAYLLFTVAATLSVPELQFIDTHARGEMHTGFGFEIKPDVTVYSTPLGGTKRRITHCDASTMEMHIEFKWESDQDPFVIPDDKQPREEQQFVKKGDLAIATLGQMTAYAAAQMSAQFRTHIFSIFLSRRTARILRWDREGVVVTEPIEYDKNPALVEFLSLYSQASPELRGVDTTISPAAEEKATLARTKLGLTPDTQMFKTSVPMTVKPTEELEPSNSKISIVFAAPYVLSELPACRGTRACPAYDVGGDRVVFLKDSWRVVAPDIVAEGDIYAKLNGANVKHVPVCIACGDVEACEQQELQTLKHSWKVWACRAKLSVSAHSHYRLVLDIAGKSLSDFISTKELVQAVHDALVAHEGAVRLKILHRDISVGNIIIYQGQGYLIDWDLAKPTDVTTPRRTSRTGTWQFMSAHLVEDRTAEHTASDDMESAFWVLLWTTLMFSPSTFTVQERSEFIRSTFESEDKSQMKRSVFTSQTVFEPGLFPGREALFELLRELANLFKYFYDKIEDSDQNILLQADQLSREILEALPAYRRQLARDRLKNHEYIIELIADHLKLKWPANDAAQEQPLISIGRHGEEVGQVALSRTRHILEVAREKNVHKRRRLGVPRQAVSDNVLATASRPDDSDA